ncbi:MAG: hypothetical protein NVSMB65_10410 [Chloroflexota bacterium]
MRAPESRAEEAQGIRAWVGERLAPRSRLLSIGPGVAGTERAPRGWFLACVGYTERSGAYNPGEAGNGDHRRAAGGYPSVDLVGG